jgi:hypothetical protein
MSAFLPPRVKKVHNPSDEVFRALQKQNQIGICSCPARLGTREYIFLFPRDLPLIPGQPHLLPSSGKSQIKNRPSMKACSPEKRHAAGNVSFWKQATGQNMFLFQKIRTRTHVCRSLTRSQATQDLCDARIRSTTEDSTVSSPTLKLRMVFSKQKNRHMRQ